MRTKSKELYRQYFSGLQEFMQELYEVPELELKDNITSINVCIPGRKPFDIREISDGYASLLSMYMELTMHSTLFNGTVNYDLPAIVLVDDLEAHLHLSLQRRIFPLLIRTFPNSQFIVTTNSPLIINALRNAAVFDIGEKKALEKATFYSYKTIVESYFCTKQQYQDLRKLVTRYRELALKKNSARKEDTEFIDIFCKLSLMTPANRELYIEFNKIEAQRAAMGNGTLDQKFTSSKRKNQM
jgi:predicted ATP-dependent endonuclease of OLD family